MLVSFFFVEVVFLTGFTSSFLVSAFLISSFFNSSTFSITVVTFLLISMNNNVYYLDGNEIINFIDNNKRKSIPFEYIEKHGYIVNKKIKPRLDYLEIIDNLYFKE